jgi:hypothetical protein
MDIKSVKINSDLHRAMKVKASEEGKNISEWLEDAVKDRLGPTKEESILDAMAVKPLLRLVYKQISIRGVQRAQIEKGVIDENPKIGQGHIDQALEDLLMLKAIKRLLPEPHSILGDPHVYRRLVELKV